MNKQEFIKEYNSFLKKENLTHNDAWVGAGGTLLLLGLREETQDIDLGVPAALFNKFKKRNLKTHVFNNDTLVIEYNNVIDIHEENDANLIIIDGVNSWTIQEVLKLKQRLNRPKDQEDIKNILAYIKKHKLSLETVNPATFTFNQNLIPGYTIREAKVSDFQEACNLRNKLAKESSYINNGIPRTEKENLEQLQQPNGLYLVVEYQSEFVAFALIHNLPGVTTLGLLGVLKAYSGQGIATALMNTAKQFAVYSKNTKLRLYVDDSNKRANVLYKRFGFQYKETFTYHEMELKLAKEDSASKELVTIVNGKKRRTRTEIYALNFEGKILSCCRPGKYPELPGGGVDIGESPIQAAQRECMEESGWIVNNLTQLTVPDNLYIDDDKNDHWFVDCGWDEEIEYAVLAKAIAYQPDHRYTKSEDSLVFSFNSIDRIIADTEEAIAKAEMSGLRLWHATFRLQALQVIKATIFPITHTRVLERPIVFNW